MDKLNWLLIMATGIIPSLIGMIYYSPKVFGNAWMDSKGITMDPNAQVNMGKMIGISIILGLFLAVGLAPIVIHQAGLFSMLQTPDFKDVNSDTFKAYTDMMTKYSTNFRTFKHGALHGTLTAIFLAVPFIAVSTMWEPKPSFKYYLLTLGYWIITLALMGGIICQFA
jgi:Protein of unknown function (DUF1761)